MSAKTGKTQIGPALIEILGKYKKFFKDEMYFFIHIPFMKKNLKFFKLRIPNFFRKTLL